MRAKLIEALQEHAKGHIAKHKANVEVLLLQATAVDPNVTEEDPAEHFVREAATKLLTFEWLVLVLSILADAI